MLPFLTPGSRSLWPVSALSSTVAGLGGGGAYVYANAEAAALAARFTTAPTNARAALIDTMVGAIKTAGVWSKLDALYVFAAADQQAALLNWVAAAYDATLVSTVSFTADRGFTGNGTSGYVSSNFNPTTASSPKFTQNDAYFGLWSRATGQQAGSAAGFFDGTNGTTRVTRNASDTGQGRINQASALATPVLLDGLGLHGIARSGAAVIRMARNGVNQTTGTNASATLANGAIRFGSISNSSFSALPFGAGAIGQNITEAEELGLYNALNTYLVAVGAA